MFDPVSWQGGGWAGAEMEFRNCFGQSIFVMKPPSAQNCARGWDGPTDPKALGVTVKYAGILGWPYARSTVQFGYNGVPVMGDGYVKSPTRPVTHRSLYTKQLEDRFGSQAVASVGVGTMAP